MVEIVSKLVCFTVPLTWRETVRFRLRSSREALVNRVAVAQVVTAQ
jgi:hypothetical protein